MFDINKTTGVLSVAKALDRDTQPLIDLHGECKVIVQVKQLYTMLMGATIPSVLASFFIKI